MCSRLQYTFENDAAVQRFNLEITSMGKNLFTDESNRYDYQFYPIVTNMLPNVVQEDYTWGLIPSWARDEKIRSNTFHARIESLDTTASYKNILHQRCLVLASGYYEWKHEDEKGMVKTKHIVKNADDKVQVFALAGLWSHWIRPENGAIVKTFTIVTTEANEVMSGIAANHRMPVMLRPHDEDRWLRGEHHSNFAYPKYDSGIKAISLNDQKKGESKNDPPEAPTLFS